LPTCCHRHAPWTICDCILTCLPQEDELATCLLTGGRFSPYMSLYFMRQEEEYREFQTFRNANPDNVNHWTQAFQ
jgi:hypothetical protein